MERGLRVTTRKYISTLSGRFWGLSLNVEVEVAEGEGNRNCRRKWKMEAQEAGLQPCEAEAEGSHICTCLSLCCAKALLYKDMILVVPELSAEVGPRTESGW